MLERTKNILIHLVRRILQILFTTVVTLICGIIYLVTYEPGTKKHVTVRKCKRIRALTKLKLYAYKYGSCIFEFLHKDYMRKLYNKFHFLIDK